MDSNPPLGSTAGKSSTGLDANIAALISYLAGWVSGLIFFLIEKESRFVRFHAMQSILLNVAIVALLIVVNIFGVILAMMRLGLILVLLWPIVGLALLAAWIFCIIKAYQGQEFKLPLIGDMAAKIVNK
jgi:uncharacterized membrane protein